ncbi:hypothetical protein SAMN05216474_0483 [Lishizhenia tianjinensis]|uniref:Patatin-like phospholipase n=1 Tax=Lishizhenia tianjinensis TaxID=477690 RepID=A0A1I6XVI4_9FLAO|nr:hypothetical protein [Lishizhenia tianjinensis]SFT42360.1 hypothetical protein SAMN05216474_0483 [Lishizhenia tianjinensis]
MKGKITFKDVLKGILDFFPFHLLIAHLKYNIVAVLYWVFLFLVLYGVIGESFGMAYLFYGPEYLGKTSWLSFLFLGFSIGGFTMAFHTYSYIRMGPHFPFIATLHRPFFKFCVNNSILPFIFFVVLGYKIAVFQSQEEFLNNWDITLYILSVFGGSLIFVLLSLLYFFPTNKDIFKIEKKRKVLGPEEPKNSSIKSSLHRNLSWDKEFKEVDDKLYVYIGKNFGFKRSRGVQHYDYQVIQNVFSQNHINASIFEITVILSFFILGLLRNQEVFVLPAASSIFLLLTIVLMLISAFFSWFKLWTYPILIVLFLVMNFMSQHTDYMQFKNFAYGLNYQESSPYNDTVLLHLQQDFTQNLKDEKDFKQTLTNWKKRSGDKQKPKLVIINTSGGGLRSALWTFRVMQHLDSVSKGAFTKSVQMVTGASGGMVGASYYREMYLENYDTLLHQSMVSSYYANNIAKDLLNGIGVSLATNDIFFRYQKFDYNGQTYTTDRGYSLEQQLLSNTNYVLDKQLKDYRQPEQEAIIPTFIFSPTIIEDGRRLIICSQDIGFMFVPNIVEEDSVLSENVELSKIIQHQDAGELRFTTALRMNATFPYITPMVTLPTHPEIHIMDAGIRDNYGAKTTLRYLSALEDWIKENTSGVVIVQIRDTKKGLEQEEEHSITLFEKMFKPLSNVYGNFPKVQDYNQDELVNLFLRYQNYPIDIVSLNLRETPKDKISLSWHLTKQEKQLIKKALSTERNSKEMQRLLKLLQ